MCQTPNYPTCITPFHSIEFKNSEPTGCLTSYIELLRKSEGTLVVDLHHLPCSQAICTVSISKNNNVINRVIMKLNLLQEIFSCLVKIP